MHFTALIDLQIDSAAEKNIAAPPIRPGREPRCLMLPIVQTKGTWQVRIKQA